MKIAIIIIIYTIFNLYVLNKILKWITAINNRFSHKIIKIIIIFIYIFCYLTPIIGYFMPLSFLQKKIQEFANYYMGILFYLVMIAILFDLVKLILIKVLKFDKDLLIAKRYLYLSCMFSIIVVISISLYGFYHAKDIKIKKYNININKDLQQNKKLKIALIADFHLGYSVGHKMMEDMSKKINKQDVDIILIAGDIFDNSDETVDDMIKVKKALRSMKSKYGTYAVFGNHDVKEKLFGGFSVQRKKKDFRNIEMEQIMIDSGVKILNDEGMFINYFYIIGRKDAEKVGDGTNKRSSIEQLLSGVDKTKPIIVVEHEPRQLDEISKQGVDLHLAAHTHAGQFFPLTIGTGLMWDNSYGLKQKKDMMSVVTSGIGVYGPNMRIGTNSEICILNVTFNKKNRRV